MELHLRTVPADRLYPVVRGIPESASYKRLHFRAPQGKTTWKPPLSLTWTLMRTSKLVSCCRIAPVHIHSQFNDHRLTSAWLFPWFPSHWKWTPSPYHCLQGVIFTCLHTPLLIPFPPPHWPQMFQSSSHPRTFARAVSFAYKALQTLNLPPPGLYLNPFGSVRLLGTLFKIVSPHSLSPVCLVTMSSALYFIAYLFWCWFSTTNMSSPVGRSFVCFVLSCVLGTQNNARHPVGTQQIRVGWMSK